MSLRARAAERWAQEGSRLRRFLETGDLRPRSRVTVLRYPDRMPEPLGETCPPDCPACAVVARIEASLTVPETYFVDETGEYGPTRAGV